MYRRLGERYSDACVREVDRFGGGGSIMVWGGISHGVKMPLVVIQGNLSRTLSGSGAYASRPPACQCS